MSKLGINTGSTPNDGTGDNLLSGAIKINSNFDELYTALGDGTTLGTPVTSIVAGTNVSVSSSTGDVTINATGGGSGSINGITIKEEGVAVGTATSITSINFVGSDVTATATGQDATITISSSGGGGGSGGIDVQDEGVALATTATTLNFVGDGVVASGTGVTKTITIAGGGGSGVGGTWTTYDSNTGVTTTKKVKIQNDLEVTGIVTATSGLRIPGGTFSDTRLELGNSQEFSFQYNTASTKGIVRVLSQDLDIEGKNIGLYPNNGENGVIANQNGAVELYYDNVKKFETTGTGATVYGTTQSQQLNVSGVSTFTGDVSLGSSISLGDGKAIMLGAGHDLQILHSGSHSVIKDVGTGNLNVNASRLLITNSDGSEYLGKFDSDGGVELYYDNNKKLETASDGINVTGGLTVTGEVTGGRIKVVGIVTATSAIIGAGSSTDGVESPVLQLTNNNPTIVGTSGTTGEIKMIGGAPFFYDGTFWREFVLSSGTPVSEPADSDWDSVIFRNDFDTSLTDQKFGQTIYSGTSNVDLVSSPVKIGTKSARIGYPNDGMLAYSKRNEYDFTGAWTIEGWFYLDTLPAGTGSNSTPLVFHTYLHTYTFGLGVDTLNGVLDFRWWNNQSTTHGYSVSNAGTFLGSYATSILDDAWCHIALVRNGTDGSIHLFVNGTESSQTNQNQVIDNDIPAFQNSYELTFGKAKLASAITTYMDGFIDDIRISTIARYTSNFNPPTTALPISGTASTSYTPPGSHYGELTLGDSPTWTGTTGVTASKVADGHYRATFSSSYNNSTDYIITTNMMDHQPVTTAVGIGVSRFNTHADFYVNRVSDGVGINTGNLAVDLIKK